MAKYCIFVSAPRYGHRDEIIGSTHHREACFTSKRTADKHYRAAWRRYGGDELYVTLCRGERYCGHDYKRQMKRHTKKKPSTSRSRRKQRRNDLPF